MVSLYLKGRVIDLYERSQATKYVYTYISKCLQKEGIVLGRKTVRDIILRLLASVCEKRWATVLVHLKTAIVVGIILQRYMYLPRGHLPEINFNLATSQLVSSLS